MNPEKKSPDLEQLKQLLAKSYDGSEAEDVPPMPDALRDRITDQYGHSATKPSPQAESQKVSFFSAITQLFATPSLRAVSAMVILLLVATVVIKTSTTSTKGPGRGGDENPSSITCILYGLDADEQAAVSASGLDEEALQTITTAGGQVIIPLQSPQRRPQAPHLKSKFLAARDLLGAHSFPRPPQPAILG